jgi:rare lipoprotein A
LNCLPSSYPPRNARRPRRPAAWPLPCLLFLLWLGCALLSACGGHKHTQAQVPPPPSLPEEKPVATPPSAETAGEDEKIDVPAGAKPIFEETGMASWYGAPYHNRRGSNGEVYNMHAMTAAHLTLPLGSIVRVTNLKTGHSAVVRITDRGPFVVGRIVDLSLAAAKALDVYLPGTAKVRLEVLRAPASLDTGGRWAVQIGSFTGQRATAELAEHLQKRYQTAKVLKFVSPVGDWWVRVRVLDDDRQRATTLAHETETTEGAVFLVRLD